MKITNISTKLMCVAGYSLLPTDSVYVDDSLVNAPIRRCADMGMLKLEEEPKTAVFTAPEELDDEVVVEEEEPVKEANNAPVEKKAPVKRTTTTRKKKEA